MGGASVTVPWKENTRNRYGGEVGTQLWSDRRTCSQSCLTPKCPH